MRCYSNTLYFYRMAQLGCPTPSVKDYFGMLKPELISAELLMAVAALFVAGGRHVSLILLAELILAGYLGLGGSAVLNSYLDRKLDTLMIRTAKRAIPSGKVTEEGALAFGISLVSLSFLSALLLINAATAIVIVVGSLLYLLFYTLFLKTRTQSAVIWGGLAGAIPAFGGWLAYTEHDLLTPFLIFLVVFFWQPGHFWPLSIYYLEDYRKAGIPVRPVKKGVRNTAETSIVYNLGTVFFTYALYFYSHLSAVFLGVMTVMNVLLIYSSFTMLRAKDRIVYRKVFSFSITYMMVFLLALIFVSLL